MSPSVLSSDVIWKIERTRICATCADHCPVLASSSVCPSPPPSDVRPNLLDMTTNVGRVDRRFNPTSRNGLTRGARYSWGACFSVVNREHLAVPAWCIPCRKTRRSPGSRYPYVVIPHLVCIAGRVGTRTASRNNRGRIARSRL